MFRGGGPNAAAAFQLRVVSYNVLSSHLANPATYPTIRPEHLEASNRLPVVLKKIQNEIIIDGQQPHNDEKKKPPKPVVVCLQEVSYDWAGEFHAFFANRGYHFVTGLYGRKYNGYMGVGLAWPTRFLDAVDVDISRLSDERPGGWPEEEEAPSEGGTTISQRLWSTAAYFWERFVQSPASKLLLASGIVNDEQEVIDHWSMSERRFNCLLTATLKDKESGQTFCIGNYHMPCAYYAPMVMTIHADMAAAHVQGIASKQQQQEEREDGGKARSVPYILAGDFNIKPNESVYRLLTTGDMHPDDACYPTPKYGTEWKPSLSKGMKSAYAEFLGREPDFTNYAHPAAKEEESEPFIDTLDYIFCSSSFETIGVRELPKRGDSGGPFPNLDVGEPSDHVLIAADLRLANKGEN